MASGVTPSQVILVPRANTIIPLSFHPFISEIGTLTPCCGVEDLSSLPGLFQFQNRKSHLPGTVLSKLGMVGSAGDGHLPPKKMSHQILPWVHRIPRQLNNVLCGKRPKRADSHADVCSDVSSILVLPLCREHRLALLVPGEGCTELASRGTSSQFYPLSFCI